MARVIGIERIALGGGEQVPPKIRTRVTPTRLTALGLESYESVPDHGVYVGDVRSVEDVMHFWNLRAAGSSLVFFDPAEAARLGPLLGAPNRWLAAIPARPWQRAGTGNVHGRVLPERPARAAAA